MFCASNLTVTLSCNGCLCCSLCLNMRSYDGTDRTCCPGLCSAEEKPAVCRQEKVLPATGGKYLQFIWSHGRAISRELGQIFCLFVKIERLLSPKGAARELTARLELYRQPEQDMATGSKVLPYLSGDLALAASLSRLLISTRGFFKKHETEHQDFLCMRYCSGCRCC